MDDTVFLKMWLTVIETTTIVLIIIVFVFLIEDIVLIIMSRLKILIKKWREK